MKYQILRALIERDALALDAELFGYDEVVLGVVDLLAFAEKGEGISDLALSDAIYEEIARGVLGDDYGKG